MIVTDARGERLFPGEMFGTFSTLARNPRLKGKGLQCLTWWFTSISRFHPFNSSISAYGHEKNSLRLVNNKAEFTALEVGAGSGRATAAMTSENSPGSAR
jgi:hypothetical protein